MEEGNPLKKKIQTPRPISSRRKGLIEREQEGRKGPKKDKMEKETRGRNNNKHERKKERKQASMQASVREREREKERE
jgi:hypothetical protein